MKEWHERRALTMGGKVTGSKIADHHQTRLFSDHRRRINLQANSKLGAMKDSLTVNTYGSNRAKALGVFSDVVHELAYLLCKYQGGLLRLKQCGLTERVVQLKEGLLKPFRHGPAPEPKTTGARFCNLYQNSIKGVQASSGHDAKEKRVVTGWR
jgi:hypothetical protein